MQSSGNPPSAHIAVFCDRWAASDGRNRCNRYLVLLSAYASENGLIQVESDPEHDAAR